MKTGFKAILSAVLCVICVSVGMPVAGAASDVDALISKMSMEEKIGQMITVSVRQWNEEDFTIMEDEVADIISKNSVGGVILFAENFTDTEQTVN